MYSNSKDAYKLLEKYNVPVPRYTSYPTVPFWNDEMSIDSWKNVIINKFNSVDKTESISLYIHLPFCESLCTYCGCNKKITQNHDVEDPYITAVLKEWQLYLDLMPEKPLLKELHLGGGTPTFFSVSNLQRLMNGILSQVTLHPEYEFSFEGHPNNTTEDHLKALYKLGFGRVSFGVQDNDLVVQQAINRIQPFENVRRVTQQARAMGFKSINFDLIYGLPFQTIESIQNTIRTTLTLRPDRVAFYSYAHVPWTSRGQRLFDENDLPTASEKLQLYCEGNRLFTDAGYTDIGMDHFSLQEDDLYKAWKDGTLHRNFMGYTTQKTSMLIGLGVSSISDIGCAYAQNHKALHDYYKSIEKGELAVTKGYMLSDEDAAFKRYILELICQGETVFHEKDIDLLQRYCFPALQPMQKDELIILTADRAKLTNTGRHFMRNICSAFDLHLQRTKANMKANTFSKSI